MWMSVDLASGPDLGKPSPGAVPGAVQTHSPPLGVSVGTVTSVHGGCLVVFSSEIPLHTREQRLGNRVLTYLHWGRRSSTSTLGEMCSGTNEQHNQVMRACQQGLWRPHALPVYVNTRPLAYRHHRSPCAGLVLGALTHGGSWNPHAPSVSLQPCTYAHTHAHMYTPAQIACEIHTHIQWV